MANAVGALLIVLGLLFWVLAFVGIIAPNIGGIWIKFRPHKTRAFVFGANFGLGLIVVIAGSVIMPAQPKDYYADGMQQLTEHKYGEAIISFKQIQKSDAHFSEISTLIKDAQEKATQYYSEQINIEISNSLDQVKAKSINQECVKILERSCVPESEFGKMISDAANAKMDSISKAKNAKNYLLVKELSEKLMKVETYKEFAKKTLEECSSAIVNAELESIQVAIQNHLAANEFEEARKEVKRFQDFDESEGMIAKQNSIIDKAQKQFESDKVNAEMQAYAANAIKVSFNDLMRNPDNYKGKAIIIRGKVTQKLDDVVFMDTKVAEYIGYFDGAVAVNVKNFTGIVEDDILTVYGKFEGIDEYSLAINDDMKKEVPSIDPEYINIIEAE